jgi:transposase
MYPIDRRIIASDMYEKLSSLRKVAYLLNTSHSTISRWVNTPKRSVYKKNAKKVSKMTQVIDTIRISIQVEPLITIKQLLAKVRMLLDVTVSRELVRIAIKRLGLTKKTAKFYGYPNNIEQLTSAFLSKRSEVVANGLKIISIDETSFGRNGFSNRGYSERGKPLYIRKKLPRMTTTTVHAAASNDAWVKLMRFTGSGTSERFLSFLKTLDIDPKTCVIMDNAKIHHTKQVKDYLNGKGCVTLYAPPYSPWFNPIELCFSKVKRSFRCCQDIDEAFESVSSSHFVSFFNKSLNTLGPF